MALLCAAGSIVVGGLALARRFRPDSTAAGLFEDVGPMALWLAWSVALVTTAGSLYFSEVAGFVPCELCWYQRIAMYPFALVLLVAALRGDRKIWVYAVPVAAVGGVVSVYHSQLQAFPDQGSFCSTITPCTTPYVWEFGFVSLPLMALVAFVFIIAMTLVARATDPERTGTP